MENLDYFLSYSRQNLYTAETLAHQLKKNNIRYWFDLEQLIPGTDWRVGIKNGLDHANAMILITSQASLSSIYVAKEWITASQQGKPIYLFVVEEVTYTTAPYQSDDTDVAQFSASMLPTIAHSVIDARGNFRKGCDQLVDLIQGKVEHISDVIEAPWSLAIPRKMPFAILYMTLLLIGLWIGTVICLYKTQVNLAAFLLNCYFILAFGQFILNFLRRNFDPDQLGWILILVPIIIWMLNPLGQQMPIPFSGMLLLLTIIFVMGAFWIKGASKDFLRWLPKGAASTTLRYGIFTNLFKKKLKVARNEGVQFKLYYHPADSVPAKQIEKTLLGNGHTIVLEESSSQECYHIIIVSHVTEWGNYEHLKDPKLKIICVQVGRVSNQEVFKEFLNRQWVDYRNRDKRILERIALALLPEKFHLYNGNSVFYTPESFDKLVIPSNVSLITFMIYGLALLGIVLATILSPYGNDIPQLASITSIIIILGFVIQAILLIHTNILIANREITIWQFMWYFFLAHFPIVFTYSLAIVLGQTNNFVTDLWNALFIALLVALVISLLYVLPFALGVVLFLHFLGLQDWLLKKRIMKNQLSSFRHNAIYWRQHILRYTVALLVVTTGTSVTTFRTDQIDTENPMSQQVELNDQLTITIPTSWFRSFVRDAREVSNFSQATKTGNLFAIITGDDTLSDYYKLLLRQKNMSKQIFPLWVAVYHPDDNSDHRIFVSVWYTAIIPNSISILGEFQSNLTLTNTIDALSTTNSTNYSLLQEVVSASATIQYYITDDYVVIIDENFPDVVLESSQSDWLQGLLVPFGIMD